MKWAQNTLRQINISATDNFSERQHNVYQGEPQQRKAEGCIAKAEQSWEKALALASWKRLSPFHTFSQQSTGAN